MNDNAKVAWELGERGMMLAGLGGPGSVGMDFLPRSPARRTAPFVTGIKA